MLHVTFFFKIISGENQIERASRKVQMLAAKSQGGYIKILIFINIITYYILLLTL